MRERCPSSFLRCSRLALLVGLVVFVLLSPFDRLPVAILTSLKVQLADLAALLILPALLVGALREWKSWLREPFVMVLAGWLVANGIGAWYSPAQPAALVKLLGTVWLSALSIASFLVVSQARLSFALRLAWIAALFYVVVGVLATLVLWSFGEKVATVASFGSLPVGPYPRIRGPFANANMAYTWIAAATAIALSSCEILPTARNYLRGLAVAGGCAAVLTISPGLVGACAALVLSIKELPDRLRRPVLLAALTGIGVISLATLFLVRPTTSGFEIQASPRLEVWREVGHTILASGGIGNGLAVPPAFYAWIPPSGEPQELTDAHNSYLSLLSQLGVVGLTLWVLVVATALCRAWAADRLLALGIVAAVVVPSLTGSFENARHLWVLIGMAAGAGLSRCSESAFGASAPGAVKTGT